MRTPTVIGLGLALCLGAGSSLPLARAQQVDGDPSAPEAFPHINVDVERGFVELRGSVPIDARDPEHVVFLELIACTPDTKEHEVLVVTPARPSHVHAALLLLGLEPGEPGSFSWDGETLVAHDPEGPSVRVDLAYIDEDGNEVVEPAWSWVRNEETGETLPERNWIFAGSRFIDRGYGERYDADGTGTLIGLTTFGSETIAWPQTISPDSGVAEPVWIADPQRTPPYATPVTIRLTPVRD